MNFDSLWTGGHLATMAAGGRGYGVIENGALGVKNGRIAWIGPAGKLPLGAAEGAAVVEDLAGGWVTPGLIDCHTHLVYAGNRAAEFEMRLKGASYPEIAAAGGGILSTVRSVRAAGSDELYMQSLPRLQAMRASGVTTLEVKSGYGLDVANEMKMLAVMQRLNAQTPVRVVPTFLGAHALPPEFEGRPDAYVDLVVNAMLPLVVKNGLAAAVDVFCETIGFTPEQTECIFQAAVSHGLPVKLHAEQLSDSKGAVLAARYRALSVDHLEYLNADDVPLLAAAACVAVLLPGAFYYLKESRKPPIDTLRNCGVPMAVSTDANPGTSPIFSIRIAMNMACVFFGLTPEEALAGVTCHAARALGLQDEIGTLAVNRAADFAVWDIASPAELAYHMGDSPLRYTVFNGKRTA